VMMIISRESTLSTHLSKWLLIKLSCAKQCAA